MADTRVPQTGPVTSGPPISARRPRTMAMPALRGAAGFGRTCGLCVRGGAGSPNAIGLWDSARAIGQRLLDGDATALSRLKDDRPATCTRGG